MSAQRLAGAHLLAAALLLLPGLAPAQSTAPKGKSYAVLVGVKDYEHSSLQPLSYTENDVEELAKLLDRPDSPFQGNVRVLTATRGKKDPALRPTAANIRKAVDAMLKDRTRKATVLVALSGHGVPLSVKDPRNPDDEKRVRSFGFFCPDDAQLRGVNYNTGQHSKLISLSWLMEELRDCGAGSTLVLMDACRNEVRAKALSISPDSVPAGVSLLLGCKKGEMSYEVEGLEHGLFFHFVLEGLKDKAAVDGEVSWLARYQYVSKQMKVQGPKYLGSERRQTPHLIASIEGHSPVLLPALGIEEKEGRATLIIRVPEGARLEIDGVPTKQTGPTRAVVSPTLKAGKEYEYTLVARWAPNIYTKTTRKRMVTVRAGTEVTVDMRALDPRQPDAVVVDEELAALYKRALEKGEPGAQTDLGVRYDEGRGVEKDEKEAIRLYKLAAGKGEPAAQHNLALMYTTGRGVEKDDKEAVRLFRLAAAQAQCALGDIYTNGRGVDKDDKEAVRHFKLAAEKGNYRAQYGLGLMYEFGQGVTASKGEALKWYRKAASQGHKKAQERVQKLEE